MKIAVYLDEVGETLTDSCDVLSRLNIHNVVLRQIWSDNICNASDNACQKLKKLLLKHNFDVQMIASNLGNIESNKLSSISDETIDRTIVIAQYFDAKFVRIFCGLKAQNNRVLHDLEMIKNWVQKLSDKFIGCGIFPLIEITNDSAIEHPSDIAEILSNNALIGVLYDPAQLIIKKNQNPFIKYWPLLKDRVYGIDIHDFKIGHGFKPIGHGDTKLKETIGDAISSNYDGWLFIEPGLGRRLTTQSSKEEVFEANLQILYSFLNQ